MSIRSAGLVSQVQYLSRKPQGDFYQGSFMGNYSQAAWKCAISPGREAPSYGLQT